MRIAHLSRVRGAADGGISLIIEQLCAAQTEIERLSSVAWFAPPQNLAHSLRDFQPDLVHVHGLWSGPNRLLARRHQLPAVIAPQGMLDPWAMQQKPRRKWLAWRLFEQANLARCGAVQAVSPAELQAVRQWGIGSPVAILPNAVALPEPEALASLSVPAWKTAAPHKRHLLFLSRFHPKKGIDVLLRTWQGLAGSPEQSDWRLVLAGYGDQGELAERVASAQARGELHNVAVIGAVFGAEKAATFLAADAFVLPSYSEGLPMAALEAMAHRLPCLLSAACNIPEAFAAGAALTAEPDADALKASLLRLFSLSSGERNAMGAAGRALVAEHFSWPQVAEQTLQLYQWILGGGAPPAFVQMG